MTTQTLTAPRLDPHLIYTLDTLVSGTMGIILLLTTNWLTQVVGWPLPASVLWGVGLFLLPWAAYNFAIGRMTRPPRAMVVANITGDALWIVGTIVMFALYATSLTPLGLAFLLGQGLAVAGVLFIKLMGYRALV